MTVHFNNLVLMTLNAWREGCYTPMAKAWTLHIWTKNVQLEDAYCDYILREMLNTSRFI